MKKSHIAGAILAALTFGTSAQTEAQAPAETGTTKAFGEIRILEPSTYRWSYSTIQAQLTMLDLGTAGWYSASQQWQARRAPDGTVWLLRTSGIYIDYAIPLPSGMN